MGVGCAAAAVHWLTVAAVVTRGGWAPWLANGIGWLVALSVSFAGHYRLTFRAEQAPLWQSARRFFALSALGFLINESAYVLLLHVGGWRYDVLLACVLVGVAVLTYWLSSRWAFRRTTPS